MSEKRPTPKVLQAFVFYSGDEELFELVDRHPELDEYVVPMIALMQAISSLMFVDQCATQDQGKKVLELSSLPGGGIVARIDDGAERKPAHYVPLILSVARNCSQFLNERGYDLLAILAAGQQDPAKQAKLNRYRQALRLCLDQGQNEEWLRQQIETEEREIGVPENRWQALEASYQMKALLMVEAAAELDDLVQNSPWMQVYVEGIPIDFAPDRRELCSALGRFCWGGAWVEERRAIKSNQQILTPTAWQVLERIGELASEHESEHPVHSEIATRIPDSIETLKQCAAEGADQVLFDRAALYVG